MEVELDPARIIVNVINIIILIIFITLSRHHVSRWSHACIYSLHAGVPATRKERRSKASREENEVFMIRW